MLAPVGICGNNISGQLEGELLCGVGWPTHCQSGSWTKAGSTHSNIHKRWINNVCHTPNSNSRKRSTTSIKNMLKPSGESFFEKAFWWQSWALILLMCLYSWCTNQCRYQWLQLQKGFDVIIINGIILLVNDLSCRIDLPHPVFLVDLSEGLPLLYIKGHSHVVNTWKWYEAPRARAESFRMDTSE